MSGWVTFWTAVGAIGTCATIYVAAVDKTDTPTPPASGTSTSAQVDEVVKCATRRASIERGERPVLQAVAVAW